jgi:hypothetical protein
VSEVDDTGADTLDRERQKHKQKQMTAIVAAIKMMAVRGRVTVPF